MLKFTCVYMALSIQEVRVFLQPRNFCMESCFLVWKRIQFLPEKWKPALVCLFETMYNNTKRGLKIPRIQSNLYKEII